MTLERPTNDLGRTEEGQEGLFEELEVGLGDFGDGIGQT